MNKRVVLITISRAIIARNLLFNNFLKLLSDKYRVVLVTPMYDNPEFKELFSEYEMIPLLDRQLTPRQRKLEQMIIAIGKALIYNPTIELRTKYGIIRRSKVRFKYTKYLIQKYLFGLVLSRIDGLKTFLRFVDRQLLGCTAYDEVIKKYNPALAFITIITAEDELAFMRNCKLRGIKTVAMAKSWDNASKFIFREKADGLAVWSQYMKEEVKKFQNYKDEEIELIGIPQFDYYQNPNIYSRNEFYKKYGLDDNKKIIFFGSEGPVCPSDIYVVGFLKKQIENGELNGYQIFIRPHFSYKDDEKRFLSLVDNKSVFIDMDYKKSSFKDGIELSLNNIVNMISAIKYSHVHITSASTLALDIAANGEYPILYAFDEDKTLPYKDSMKRLYDSLWMREILKMGLDNLVNDEKELLDRIKNISNYKNTKFAEHKNLVDRFCYKIDGQSGKRLFEYIDKMTNNDYKTIFITVSRGGLVRNILRTKAFNEFVSNKNNRIVILLPGKVYKYFREEFDYDNVVLEPLKNKVYPRWRKFFIILFNGLVYTETEHRMLKFGGATKGPAPKWQYYLKHFTFSIISRVKFLKKLARWIEQYIFIERDYDYLFEKYQPDVLFCSSIYSKIDVILIKAAKRFKVPSISMPKSWDTVGRLFFRAPSNKIILNNSFMKDWIKEHQLIQDKDISVAGFPQFDIYKQKNHFISKEDFCIKYGLDKDKPIILFASEGLWTHWDDIYIDDLINNHNILEKYNLILRPHFSNLNEKKYHRFKQYKNVYIDDENVRITNMFGDLWDPTVDNMSFMADVINISDVVITFMTTFVLDVQVFDKPVINIYYDLENNRKKVIPMKELYNCTHYNAVMDEKSTVLAENGSEVMSWIEKYISDMSILRNERKNTIDKLCYKVDGNSANRIFDQINQFLNTNK